MIPQSKVLITGGAGFIGSAIARLLVAQQIPVIIQDSFVQYYSPLDAHSVLYHLYMEERLKDLRGKITLVRGDTCHRGDVRRLFEEHRPTHVIHLAALPISDLSNVYTEEAVEGIVLGTLNLLETIRESQGVQRFIYTSSSMVYGDFECTPADENHPKRPKGVYGAAKLCGEILVETFGRRFGLEYAIVRPSAVYGPTDVNRRVSQVFVEDALMGKPLVVKGAQSALDFTYVKDAADGFVRAAFRPEGKNEIFNVTRGEQVTLERFVEAVSRLIPGTRYTIQPGDPTQPKRGALDISKARRLLGYDPRYSIEKGLREYVEFVSSQLEKVHHGQLTSTPVAP